MINPEEIKILIDTDVDFIAIRRFDFSLKKLLERYPDGVPTRIICTALQMDETQVEDMYQELLAKLKLKLE